MEIRYKIPQLDENGKISTKLRGRAEKVIYNIGTIDSLKMVVIPSGDFQMGSDETEFGSRANELPKHSVTIPSFSIGQYPVTQAQWLAVMGELPEIDLSFRGDNLPAVNISWMQVDEFCKHLTAITGTAFRLPSEAEWEYACRAGTSSPFHFGGTISTDVANFNGGEPYGNTPKGQFRKSLTPVGYFDAPNAFGLHDMHGNIWEWCSDIWHDNYHGAPGDSNAWFDSGDLGYRVQRGGCWRDNAISCRSAFRVGDIAYNWDHIVGLRVATNLV